MEEKMEIKTIDEEERRGEDGGVEGTEWETGKGEEMKGGGDGVWGEERKEGKTGKLKWMGGKQWPEKELRQNGKAKRAAVQTVKEKGWIAGIKVEKWTVKGGEIRKRK